MKRPSSQETAPSVERAQALSDQGSVVEALEELDRVIARGPDGVALRLQKVRFLLQRRNYEEAARECEAAERLSPNDPAVASARAELFVMTDRLAQAQAQYEGALRGDPGNERFRLSRLRILIQRGLKDEAEKELAVLSEGSPWAKQEARLAQGLLWLKLKNVSRATQRFSKLMRELPKNDPVSMRARFYWAASRAVDPDFRRRTGMQTPAVKTGTLYLCGLGIFPPYTASLEVIHSLTLCDVVFNNVAGPEVRELLAEFCDDIRPATYQAWQDEPKWADRIFAELEKGKTVAFVTRGHPLVFGGLAVELIRRSKAQEVTHHCFGTVSSIDHILAYTGKGLGDDFGGIQALDRPAIEKAKTMNTQVPLLACFYAGMDSKAEVAAFSKSLQRFYPAEHLCWMFGPKYDNAPVVVKVGELAKQFPTVHASLMLYVPVLETRGSK